MFSHVHILSDGTIIEHTHLYNKSHDSDPYKTHHHSNDELLFLKNLDILYFFIVGSIVLLTSSYLKQSILSFEKVFIKSYFSLHLGREPPIT